MANTFDLFKSNLEKRGIFWSDQQINNYISNQEYKNQVQPIMQADLSNEIMSVVKKWEYKDSVRAKSHNNPGAHIWTPELEAKFGAQKGEAFVGPNREGGTGQYWTAKYSSLEQGEKASNFVTNNVINRVIKNTGLTPRDPDFGIAFAREYSGSQDPDVVANYGSDISAALSKYTQNIGSVQSTVQQKGSDLFSQAKTYKPEGWQDPVDTVGEYAWDFIGNAAWTFADLTTFGFLDYLDVDHAVWGKEYGQEEGMAGPRSFAGRVGAGIGGFGGFLVPFMGTKAAVGGAIKGLSKFGARRTAKSMAQKGAQFLSKEAKVVEQGAKKFKNLPISEQNKFMNFLYGADDTATQGMQKIAATISSKKGKDAFLKAWTKNSDEAIKNQLKKYGLDTGDNTVAGIKNIIDKSLGLTNKSVQPIVSLQQRIAISLGGTPGAGKVATIASHALEEGILFGLVETPMEIFQALDEERDIDMGGRWKHAMALGSALGVIRMVPGGLKMPDGQDFKVGREAVKLWTRSTKNKRPYASYNVNDPAAREQLVTMGRSLFKKISNKSEFSDDLITTLDDITRLGADAAGGKKLVKVLENLDKNWNARWKQEFYKEAASDLVGSMPRMFLGAMAFNYEMVFDDNIPLEDKVFNFLLGAFMTKQGRRVDYVASNGQTKTFFAERHKHAGKDLIDANNYLELLGINPKEFGIREMIEGELNEMKHLKNLENNDDIKGIKAILEKNNLIVNDTQAEIKVRKNGAVEGENPIYDQLMYLFDGYLSGHGQRLKKPSELTTNDIKKIEKILAEKTFQGAEAGVRNVNHLDDIIYNAADKAMKEVVDTHIQAAVQIYNHLGVRLGRSLVSEEVGPLGKPVLRRFLPIRIEGNATLSEPNKLIIDKYNRIVKALHGRELIYEADHKQVLQVTENDFKGLAEKINSFEVKIETLINGTTSTPEIGRAYSLMQEGYLMDLILNQGFHRGVRQAHLKVTDFESTLWGDSTGAHDGKQVAKLITQVFKDNSSLLVSGLDMNALKKHGGSDADARFFNTLLEALKSDPKFEQSIIGKKQGDYLEGDKVTVDTVRQLKELRKIFKNNGLDGFSNINALERKMFLDFYRERSIDQFFKGATKKDGSLLTANDRLALSKLLDYKLLTPNMDMVDVIGVVNAMSSKLNNIDAEILKLNESGKMGKGWRVVLDTIFKNEPTLSDSFDALAREMGVGKEFIAEELLTSYKNLISPYLASVVNGKRTGFIKTHTETIAQIQPHTLREMILQLKSVSKDAEGMLHNTFIDNLKRIKDNQKFDLETRDQLNWIFSVYSQKNVSSSRVIDALRRKGYFDINKEELNLDPTKKGFKDDIKDIYNDAKFELANNTELTKLEDQIGLYRSTFNKEAEIEIFRNVTLPNFKKKYSLPEDFEFNRKTTSKELIEISKLYDNNNKELKYEDMQAEQQLTLLNDVQQLMLGSVNQKSLKRLSVVEGYGVFTDSYVAMDNHLFREVENIFGADSFAIVDYFVAGRNNKLTNARNNEVLYSELANRLAKNKVSIDKNLKTDDRGVLEHDASNGHIIIRVADLSFGIGVSRTALPRILESFEQRLKVWEKNNPNVDAKVFQDLRQILKNSTKDKYEILDPDSRKGTGKFRYEWTETDAISQGERLQTMFNFMFLDKNLGKTFWDHMAKETPESTVKFNTRTRLLANMSMKELSTDFIKNTYDFYNSQKAVKDLNPDMLAGLKRLVDNNGMKVLLAADEMWKDGQFEKGASANIVKELKKQIDAEIVAAGDTKVAEFDATGNNWAGGETVSKYDSYMGVNTQTMKALYGLAGASNVEGLGALKPIIHKVGKTVLIGKTAFIADPRLDAMLNKNNLDAVMFGSASKITNVKKFKDWETFDDLTNLNLAKGKKAELDDFTVLLKGEDISLGSIVNADHNSTISYSALNHLSLSASNKAFNWLLRGKLEDVNKMSQSMFDTNDLNQGLAYSKYLTEGMGSDNVSAYSRWLNNNGLPQISTFAEQFTNQLKSNLIDKPGILSMNTGRGGQSVTSPGENLKFTTFVTDRNGNRVVNTYGEAELPFAAGEKRIDLNNTHFIKSNNKGRDKILTYKEFVKETNDASIKDNMKVKDVVEKLQAYEDMFLHANFRRDPHTRQGDISSIKVKGILDGNFGNTVKLNAYDFAMRHEGDHDVDKLNYWWDTPTEVVREWDALAGKVLRVNPDGADLKTSLPKDLSFTNPQSMNKFYAGDYAAQKMRGTIVKMPRLLNALKTYSSGGAFNKETGRSFDGFSFRLRSAEGGGKLFIDPVKFEKTLETLATDIQNITDSRTGYNAELYNSDWMNKVFFGDPVSKGGSGRYSGIFSKAAFNKEAKGKHTWIPSDVTHEFTLTEKAVIREALQPYSQLLSIASGKFETGKREKISYDDIMSITRTFDSQMANLHKHVYFKLKNKTGIDKEELSRMFFENNKFVNPFGTFGENIRPNFSRERGADMQWFEGKLPFERAMSVLAFHDNMKLKNPEKLGGEMLSEFSKFSEIGMYSENFGETVTQFIQKLNTNHKFLGYLNYLDYRIRGQEKARARASANDNRSLSRYLTENIEKLKSQKEAIEKEMILGGTGQAAKWARGIKEASKREVIDDMIKNKRPPKGWKQGELPSSYDMATVSAWARKNDVSLDAYLKDNNIIRVEGSTNAEQIERLIWHNAFDRYSKIFISESIETPELSKKLENDVKDFKDFYRKSWRKNFQGQDWYMDKTRTASMINDRLERYFKTWQGHGNYGQLFLWKVMNPETKKFSYTYLHDRLTPSFKKESLSMIKVGLNFISSTKEITEFSKEQIFGHLATHVNNSLKAVYGASGERGTVVHNTMTNAANHITDVRKGFPLLDEISTYSFEDWGPSFQQRNINPGVSRLFGFENANKNVAYHMASQPLMPSFAKEMAGASFLTYMPTGYIPEFVSTAKYGSINGGQSYLKALENGAEIMLGNAQKMNLTYGPGVRKSPVKMPYENLQPDSNVGSRESLIETVKSKVNGGC